jgi:hypothetical protein
LLSTKNHNKFNLCRFSESHGMAGGSHSDGAYCGDCMGPKKHSPVPEKAQACQQYLWKRSLAS